MAIEGRFRSSKEERQGLDDTLAYFKRVDKGDLRPPEKAGLKYLARTIDQASKRAYDDLALIVRQSPEHLRRKAELEKQPRTVGKSSVAKAILKSTSSFEQMVALDDWVGGKKFTEKHTFCLAKGDDDYVPVSVKSSSLMDLVLGSTRGDHKAPKYDKWAEKDPWKDPYQEPFIYPLEALEMVRQPSYIGATVLKGNAFESEWIDQEWRYGATKGCVETRGQRRESQKKRQSAGLNLAALAEEWACEEDPKCKDVNICLEPRYENYADEGYQDDRKVDVSPGKLIAAARKTIVAQDPTDLDALMKQLFIAKIGGVSTPALREHIVAEMFPPI